MYVSYTGKLMFSVALTYNCLNTVFILFVAAKTILNACETIAVCNVMSVNTLLLVTCQLRSFPVLIVRGLGTIAKYASVVFVVLPVS